MLAFVVYGVCGKTEALVFTMKFYICFDCFKEYPDYLKNLVLKHAKSKTTTSAFLLLRPIQNRVIIRRSPLLRV